MPRLLRRAALAAGAFACVALAGVALAQPEQAPAQTLPFFDANGLPHTKLRWSDVENALGKPGKVVETPYDRRKDTGGQIRLEYPDLGLKLEVNAEDADARDPRIGWLTISAPNRERTPQGLYLGQSEDEAMAIAQATYRMRGSIPLSWDQGRTKGTSVLASNQGWRRSQSVTLTFREKRLHQMVFQVNPRPWIDYDTRSELISLTVLLLIALIATPIVKRIRKRMKGDADSVGEGLGPAGRTWGEWFETGRYLVAAGFGIVGVIGVYAGVAALKAGDGYVKWAGLIYLLLGLGALFWTAMVLTSVRNAVISTLAKVIIGAIVVGVIVLQVSGGR